VFGAVSGEEAAKHAMKAGLHDISKVILEAEEKRVFDDILGNEGPESMATVRNEMRHVMNEKAWIYRTGDLLESGLKEIRQLKQRFKKIKVHDKGRPFNTGMLNALQLDFMLDLAEITMVSALPRRESRGAHSRTDYPKRDDQNWLKHSLVYYTKEGPRLEYSPVTITRWQPAARTY
jgi:succinate dehydrogenase / fumarate reductase flavoprotein subunit